MTRTPHPKEAAPSTAAAAKAPAAASTAADASTTPGASTAAPIDSAPAAVSSDAGSATDATSTKGAAGISGTTKPADPAGPADPATGATAAAPGHDVLDPTGQVPAPAVGAEAAAAMVTAPAALPAESGAPVFWPMAIASSMLQQGLDLYAKNLRFVAEDIAMNRVLRPKLATPSTVRLELRTMTARDYGTPGTGIPVIVDAPFAGHTAVIADYDQGQSLIETLLANGIGHVVLTDWKSATPDMKDLEIDNYLEEMLALVDDLGGRVHLVGLCQGGWLSTMLAARYPDKVASLVLAGTPIDTDAGDGPIKRMAQNTPLSFYEELVRLGGGLMKGKFMLQGWKNMHPEQHYLQEHLDLYAHIDDPAYVRKEEVFQAWYETTLDLPGRWYLQAIDLLFKQNRLAKGEFVALGRQLDLRAITCPLYLLGGAQDDITPPDQVLAAAHLVGTPPAQIVSQVAPGGHIGLFMGSRTLRDYWPGIARWIEQAA